VSDFRKAKVREVRTGDVIAIRGVRKDLTLTVHYPIWEKHTAPDGFTQQAVWFAGVDSTGKRVEKGWGQKPDTLVYVVEEAPRRGNTFGALDGIYRDRAA
jgi:hypothetical protein